MRTRLLILLLALAITACSSGTADVAARYDLCFTEDYPGATDRYVQYTPVRCSDPNIKLAEPIGAERASLEASDVDNDGLPEIVISSEFWCRWGFEPCINPTRTTLKISGDRQHPVIAIVREEVLTPAKEFR